MPAPSVQPSTLPGLSPVPSGHMSAPAFVSQPELITARHFPSPGCGPERGSGKALGVLSPSRADTETQVYLELTHSLRSKEKVGLEILPTYYYNMIFNLV